MATIAEKIAESLEQLKQLQEAENFVVLHGTEQLSRVHLTRLLSEGWLKEVPRYTDDTVSDKSDRNPRSQPSGRDT